MMTPGVGIAIAPTAGSGGGSSELVARVTVDQSMTPNSAALQNVTDLVIPLAANTTYKFRAEIIFNVGNNLQGAKSAFVAPGSLTMTDMRIIGKIWDLTTRAVVADNFAIALGTSVSKTTISTGEHQITWEGMFTTNTAGDLQYQQCQGTADANTHTVRRGSWVSCTPVT